MNNKLRKSMLTKHETKLRKEFEDGLPKLVEKHEEEASFGKVRFPLSKHRNAIANVKNISRTGNSTHRKTSKGDRAPCLEEKVIKMKTEQKLIEELYEYLNCENPPFALTPKKLERAYGFEEEGGCLTFKIKRHTPLSGVIYRSGIKMAAYTERVCMYEFNPSEKEDQKLQEADTFGAHVVIDDIRRWAEDICDEETIEVTKKGRGKYHIFLCCSKSESKVDGFDEAVLFIEEVVQEWYMDHYLECDEELEKKEKREVLEKLTSECLLVMLEKLKQEWDSL